MTYTTSKLSVGLILRSNTIWAWQADLIQTLMDSQQIAVEKCVMLGSDPSLLPSNIERLYRLDSMLFRSTISAYKPVKYVAPDKVEIYDDPNDIKKSGIDIWINLSEFTINIDCLGHKTSFLLETHFSENLDDSALESSGAGYREFATAAKQCYFAIVARKPDGSYLVISESRPSLNNDSLSRSMNQYWKLLNYAWLRTCLRLKTESLKTLALSRQDNLVSSKQVKSTGLESSAYKNLGKLFINKFRQKFLHKEQWVLLLKFHDQSEMSSQLPLSFEQYIEISPPSDCFWADPFVVTENGRHYVFFEELPFATEIGHLSCMEVFQDGSHSDPKIILKKPYHLSYPNVFSFESSYYMIPESGDTGSVSLYKCSSFPYEWQFERNLLEGLHAYDSTLVEFEGLWWLFACVAAEKGMSGNEELHVFYAESPLTDAWMPHSNNPIISDASRARPAGKFFEFNGALYRPSQDCAGSYGAGININKIVDLTIESYKETLVECSRPNWNPKLTALHTLNFNQFVSVADAMRVENRFLSQ